MSAVFDAERDRRTYEFAERQKKGWLPFGFHVAYPPGIELDFDGEDEGGLPEWERIKGWDQ